MYEPTWESVAEHPLPDWYDDAKLGVFLHWGLYTVPGWAPQVANIQDLLREHGPAHLFANNPYAEWYLNTMKVPGSPTQRHHRETYGANFAYDEFIPAFDEGANSADLESLAALCKRAGAGYVVLTTKHHEGFALWPSSIDHPTKGRYHAERDIVGDLTAAVEAEGMRMGLYYSGGYDWPFNGAVLRHVSDSILAVPADPRYREFATAHVSELIERYRPAVLWNDIAWPPGGNLAALFAEYYNAVPDGVINDRWLQAKIRNRVTDIVTVGAGRVVEGLWRMIPDRYKNLTFPAAQHHDFTTPEYATFDDIRTKKWEATRGVGHSFGANRNERPEDIVTSTELVRTFVDVVSKNGNMLIGIGPDVDGSIPEIQQVPLRGLGEWMAVNREAVVGTRPWDRASGVTTDGTPLRFTRSSDAVYAVTVEAPGSTRLEIRDVDGSGVEDVRLLGTDDAVEWSKDGGRIVVTLPERLPVSPAHALRLAPADGVRSTA